MTPEFGSPRTAIVTGGARRIGRALCEALAEDGWTLLIHCNRSGAEAAALADRLGPHHRVVQADLAMPDGPARALAALDGLPPPALLVNNASLFDHDGLGDMTPAGWDRHMAVNARAPAFLTQGFAERVDGGGGLVVNLLDAKLANPNPDFFSYTVSKMAFAGMGEIAARQLAPRGIRVVAIAPAVTLVSGPQSRDNFEAVHRMTALGRGVGVEDIVAALRYAIASPVLTGQTITLDAGQRFLRLPRDVQFMGDDQ